jgi:xylan 1,4-beta-xylosidase
MTNTALKAFITTLALIAVTMAAMSGEITPSTFCNPLPIPDYPIGRLARTVTNGESAAGAGLWLLERKEQFRELADPTALWHEGKWYLYPSVDMAWVSADNGATWQHHPLNVRDVGYAPTVVKHRGKFFLMASDSVLYSSDSALGPFTEVGRIQIPRVAGMPGFTDPMLFSDDDGRLLFYWGCTREGGIWGAELDAANPTKPLTTPKELIPFDPITYPWEAVGDWNQNTTAGWVEGSWMVKHDGKYFLTFSAAGTQNRTYAMGCYMASSPLGPFTPQKRNPFFRNVDGLLTGTAHGCIVSGPEDRLWTIYTIRAGVAHGFERRLGMDRVEIDTNGELYVPTATSLPQWLPGKIPAGQNSAETGWVPINGGMPTTGSSSAPNLLGRFAVDNELRTWWQPATEDLHPILISQFPARATIQAVRVIWRDVGLDTHHGSMPGPFRYRVELETAKDQWTAILDRSESNEDLLIDYREVAPTVGSRARLVILGWPKGITPGVSEFTVFGKTVVSK